ncbi:MAG: alkaline phosphatase family protein [Gammaproteobacteria bacterium]|nr:alkaline phosphatase family protein [Gammaproteobacteria bacterium]
MASLSWSLGGGETGYPPLTGFDHRPMERARNVVLLVIDGLGHQYLNKEGSDSVMRQHCLRRLTSVCPSTTTTAIPTFLTGVPPQQHGFTGWFTYFTELGSVVTVLPFCTRLGGIPIESSVISPADLSGVPTFYKRVPVSSHVVMPDWIARSTFNQSFSGGARISSFNGLTGLYKGILKAVGQGKGRNFIYAYWPEFDALAHHFGVASQEAADHFHQLDRLFIDLISALQGTDTLLLLTADHGFIDSSARHTVRLENHPEFKGTLMAPLCGEPRMAFCYVHPHRQRRFEHYLAENLDREIGVYASQRLLQEGWFGLGEPHPGLQDRIGHYTLVMKENFKITGRLPGERSINHIGVHGGLSPDEMYVPLVASDTSDG